jgi:hypothetical protein
VVLDIFIIVMVGVNRHFVKMIFLPLNRYWITLLFSKNFCAVSAIAEITGESEFALMVYKRKNGNIYLNKVTTVFGKEPSVGVL